MTSLLQPVILRMIFYVLSPLIAMIPVSLAGLIVVQLTEAGHLLVDADLKGLVAVGITAAIGSGGVFAKFGKR